MHVNSTNLKPFVVGLVICSMGSYLAFTMLESTSWTTYKDYERGTYPGEFGEVTYDYDYDMRIGLRNSELIYGFEECDEDKYCYNIDIDEEFEILENPFNENNQSSIDCENSNDSEEIMLCDTDSSGSTGYSIIAGGLGLVAFTILLACIGVVGYIPGWVLKILNSLAAIVIFIGPIAWFVLMPDLNEGSEPEDAKWGLSYAFYLTLTSSPVIFVGGFFFGRMEAFALDKEEDWDDDYDEENDDYSAFSRTMSKQKSPRTLQRDNPSPSWQGAWGDDGYEWIEHPEGSEIWFWRDQETGQWVRH